MSVTIRSFAKINIGLAIGTRRRDGFHSLRTVYQTISLSDTLKVDVQRGSGIEIRCRNSRFQMTKPTPAGASPTG